MNIIIQLAITLPIMFGSNCPGSNGKQKESKQLNTRQNIEKSVIEVKEGLFAARFELDNLNYNYFLESLKNDGKTTELEKCKVDTALWSSGEFNAAYNKPMEDLYHKHPAYWNYPAVNITYEAAELYCEWLTEHYHKMEKRKYEKVKFRLPTKEEWELAAKGGTNLSPYPWGGPYLRNAKGCYLCNFKPMGKDSLGNETPRFIDDGGFHTVSVSSYVPNELGLYCFSGNIAEMVQEKGTSKGGSWFSDSYHVQINAEEKYEAASPTLGFRYFMEVIEE